MKTKRLLEAIQTREQVSGLTHAFYRYPARFSPLFVREAISQFSEPGDLVFDPFMGGGTTIVESKALGRHALGTDVSSLAVFLARSKSRVLSSNDLQAVRKWVSNVEESLNAHGDVARADTWLKYQKNISCKATWPIRKLLEQALSKLSELGNEEQEALARCVLLRTGQWALDCRTKVPNAATFKRQFAVYAEEMLSDSDTFREAVLSAEKATGGATQVICLHRSAAGIESENALLGLRRAPKLVVTSPPYPGVHVLYHRWQVQGRRETPAPFWIAGSLDGCGASFYTFGDRHQSDLSDYYVQARGAFSSVAKISDRDTTIVQMIAFSEPEWQLPKYLEMLAEAGLEERKFKGLANAPDGRVWRSVPNRKWYATREEQSGSSSEVVLFHQKRA